MRRRRGPAPTSPARCRCASAVGGLKRGFAALGVRNYRLYWSGQVVSLIGTWMQQVSLPWLVLALGGSPIQLGFVAMLQFGPALILAPFGGVLIDRVDKRRALMVTQLAAASQALVLFALTATGVVEIPMVMGMALLARPRERRRHAAAPGDGRGPRAAPHPRQRDRPQLDGLQLGARRGAGAGRRDHRHRHERHRLGDGRRGGQPRRQHDHLCRGPRRPVAHGPDARSAAPSSRPSIRRCSPACGRGSPTRGARRSCCGASSCSAASPRSASTSRSCCRCSRRARST